MALIERIQKDLTEAMMSKDELRLSVLRMIKSALKYKEIEKVRPLEDAESLQVLQTLMKQRRESVEQFARGGRQDLVDKETKEIAILEIYMPAAPFRRRSERSDRSRHCGNRSKFSEGHGRGDQSGQSAPRRKDGGWKSVVGPRERTAVPRWEVES